MDEFAVLLLFTGKKQRAMPFRRRIPRVPALRTAE
jgi:hypothetical protein